MGNCCGKPSDKNFSGEGRTVGSTPAARPKQTGTSNKTSAPSGGRTLGSSSQAPNESSPREAAAKAAEERAKASQGGAAKGKLGKQLDAQRSQTQSDTLKQNARDNVAARDADAGAQARQWN
ncbi:hypothetical protein WHR41_05871 [Cladosporium halotolerans]|uniref:Uncharacterized protein n=1 Tax=Cladosporium halotolerans TaxID=1052096 RepID=A0AB34KNU1_9PEZI